MGTATDGPSPEADGKYRLQRLLTTGATSDVYVASRVDGTLPGPVALKVVKPGVDTAQVVRRFVQERQLLASLSHPNISALLDGGTTSDGRPYFVMEYVDGVPIDVVARVMSINERLALFRVVCSAVQYAHQNLVVHRDLKPGNILVTATGSPKLLDFGIAKLLNPELAPYTMEPTAPGLRLMTPQYASPEQVRGEPATTSFDIYALGVLLYELLAGRRPYRLEGLSPLAVTRCVCEYEPRPPSAVVGQATPAARAQQRQLRGDLDAIVTTAMHKEPGRRYASAEALSADIQRHLDAMPVCARRRTRAYGLTRFARRHRAKLWIAGALALLAVGVTVTAAGQIRAAAVARQQAEREENRAAAISRFIVDLFDLPDQREPRRVTVRQFVDRGAQRVAVAFEGQPELRATLMEAIGVVYRNLGLYDSAEPLIEGALAERRRFPGANHPRVAHAVHNLALLRYLQGDPQVAAALHREALALRRAALGAEHPHVADSLLGLAEALHERGDYDDPQAEALVRQALAIRRNAYGPRHPEVAAGLVDLASIVHARWDHEGAKRLLDQALDIQRQRLPPGHLDIARTLNGLAVVRGDTGDYRGAEPLLRESLRTQRDALGEHADVATALFNVAFTRMALGDYEEAERLHRRALGMRRRLLGDGHPHLVGSLNAVARALRATDDLDAAEKLHREALRLAQRTRGLSSLAAATSLAEVASVQALRGQNEAAVDGFGEALAMARDLLPDDHRALVKLEAQLGSALVAIDPARAEATLRRVAASARRTLPSGHWRVAEIDSRLSACLVRRDRPDEARALLRTAIAGLRASLGGDHPLAREAQARLNEMPRETAGDL